MNRDELISARIVDCIRRCTEGMYVVSTKFLDSHEQALANSIIRKYSGLKYVFYGGYSDADRNMLVCIPEELATDDADVTASLLRILHIEIAEGSKKLGHRDYLGSVLNLGIDRAVIGDILVRDDGADMIIIPEIEDFLISEYKQVAHTRIKTCIYDIDKLIIPEQSKISIRDTIPSTRLDNLVSAAFKVSRSDAVKAINQGLVSVDHRENTKADAKVTEGCTLVLRGKGKAVIKAFGGESKKGRIWVEIERYID